MQNPSRVLLLTTMNEITGLRAVWDKIPFDLFNRGIIVDAHSTDGTLDFLKGKQCEVIFQHSEPAATKELRKLVISLLVT